MLTLPLRQGIKGINLNIYYTQAVGNEKTENIQKPSGSRICENMGGSYGPGMPGGFLFR
jgi:hypothetical protein